MQTIELLKHDNLCESDITKYNETTKKFVLYSNPRIMHNRRSQEDSFLASHEFSALYAYL
jgi:hypothetical protein